MNNQSNLLNRSDNNEPVVNQQNNPNSNFVNDFMNNPKETIAKELMNKAEENIAKGWTSWFKCCNLDCLQQYFDVTTEEVRDRILNSFIPFNPKFHDISHKNPDLYGPFWIYTTLIFLIAASGSFTKYLENDTSQDYFQVYVPKAASIIYGIGFVLPFILTCLMKCFGTDISFVSIQCTYAYSFSMYIPCVLLCSFSPNTLQWCLIGYSVVSSTGFLLVNYWKELNKYVKDRKYFVLGVVFIAQVCLFFSLKMVFFENTLKISTPTTKNN